MARLFWTGSLVVFLALLHLISTAPFSSNTVLTGSDTGNDLKELIVATGVAVQSIAGPEGLTFAKDANLDAYGEMIGLPFYDERVTPSIGYAYALNSEGQLTRLASLSFDLASESFRDVMIDGNDIWINLGKKIVYLTRGATSGTIIYSGSDPLKSAQLVGSTLWVVEGTTIKYMNPIVKSGTGTLTTTGIGSVTNFYLYDPQTMYVMSTDISLFSKYTLNNQGTWTRIYYGGSFLDPVSVCAVSIGGTTYITYVDSLAISLYRLVDSGTAITGKTMVDPFNLYFTVAPVPKPSCYDGAKNQDETDVDCGAAKCPKCADAKLCSADTDCLNGFCNAGNKCATPTCSDNAKNQDESDIDCGGSKCSKCALNKGCTANSDCLSNLCDIEICAPSCSDGMKNQDESDVDCGGQSCTPCGNGKTCRSFDDCSSLYCNPDDKCSVESCNDGYANQDETDVDCGGSKCSKCADTKSCLVDTDCSNGFCNSGQCATPTCSDSEMNQDETDVDCGGNTCSLRCALGKKCIANEDCLSSSCDAKICNATCSDNVKNQDETDVDCGGTTCNKCNINKKCSIDSDCTSNTCSSNVCVNAPVAIPIAIPVTVPVSIPVAEPQAIPIAAPVTAPVSKVVSFASMTEVSIAMLVIGLIV